MLWYYGTSYVIEETSVSNIRFEITVHPVPRRLTVVSIRDVILFRITVFLKAPLVP